jgi:hypothetical protein
MPDPLFTVPAKGDFRDVKAGLQGGVFIRLATSCPPSAVRLW